MPPPSRSDPPRTSGPLSFGQQRLWLLDQLEPGLTNYSIPFAWHIDGDLDDAALERALHGVLERHAILRTTYGAVGGDPTQVVTTADRFALERSDLGHVAPEPRQIEASRIVAEEVARPFDLGRDLMLRAHLIRLRQAEHVLILVIHHIAFDGWSTAILHRELEHLYASFRDSETATLPELPIQYLDYAAWQRGHLEDTRLERQLAYWRRQLDGLPSRLELPVDHPRPERQSFRGRLQWREFPQGQAARLRELGRAEGCTPFMMLLAAFKVLLHRYTGGNDIFVGAPIGHRTRIETEPLIGFLVNTLVLRTDLSGRPSFREVLHRVRKTALQAYSHHELPFEMLVEELHPERKLSHSPLVQVMFSAETGQRPSLRLPGLRISRWEIDHRTSKYDLSLFLIEDDDRLTARLEYAEDLFEPASMVRLLGHLQQLLDAVVAEPDRPIGDLPLLTGAEQLLLLRDWNRTTVPFPREVSIHEMFERQATRQPDEIALWQGDRRLTYGELNAKANQVAHRLRRIGVREDMAVGLCLARSIEMVAAVLGILKAGGAYLPLDLDDPQERLSFLMRDSQLQVLITDPGGVSRVPSGAATILVLTPGFEELDSESRVDPGIPVSPEQLAYLNYTSGSTGVPKAVGVPHRAVMRLVFGNEYARLDTSTVTVHLSPISFDAATFELWGPLLHGGQCVLYPQEIPEVATLAELVRRHCVTIVWLTTALFHSMAEQGLEGLAGVEELLTGGEVLAAEWVRRAQRSLPGTTIVHCYGPTEATTFTTYYRVPPLGEDVVSVPIGRPLANTRVYVLNLDGQPVPVGVPGELYIGGDALARGYLGRPDLTAQSFVPDPFDTRPGSRLYRTGDQVRWRADGVLEFLGRLDNQVKIRGFRVEPGEVETIIRRHPAVRQVVVVAREAPRLGRLLVAYVVADDPTLSSSQLHAHCRASLPVHACPSSYVRLASLPLTPNGKIDRRALPDIDAAEVVHAADAGPPQNILQLRLLNIFRQLLDQPELYLDDDFFALGGHSLLAVRLFAEIERQLGRQLPLATLFQASTPRQLAAKLSDGGWKPPWSCLVALQEGGDRPPLFLVHPVGGNVLSYYPLSRELGAERPVYALQAVGLDGHTAAITSVEEMAAYYLAEITTVQPTGPHLLGGASFGGLVAYEMAQQLIQQGGPAALVILLDSGPMERLRDQRLAAQRENHRLVRRIQRHAARIRTMSWRDRLGYVAGGWSRFSVRTARERRSREYLAGRQPGGPGPRLSEYLRVCHRAAAHSYHLRPYPGEVVFFLAEGRPQHDIDAILKGWTEVLGPQLPVVRVPGDHSSMMDKPHVQVVAARLREILEMRPPSSSPTITGEPSQGS